MGLFKLILKSYCLFVFSFIFSSTYSSGCGKTTQVPQFLLEEALLAGRGSQCHVVCTQPRRISAITVAQRVAEERGEELGNSVGYQIRLEASVNRAYKYAKFVPIKNTGKNSYVRVNQ